MPIISSFLTLVVIITCLLLANWQHTRAQGKQQRLDDISAVQSKGAMNLSALNNLPSHVNKTGILLQLSGHLQSDQYWLLDNSVFNKQVGFDVLTMFTPDNSEQVMIVNLGWIKAPASREQPVTIELPKHAIILELQLKQGDLAGFYLQEQQANTNGWPKRIQYVDLATMQQESGIALLDFIGYSRSVQFGIQPHYQPVVMLPEKHLAYALQWLLLALAALLVFIFAVKPFKSSRRAT